MTGRPRKLCAMCPICVCGAISNVINKDCVQCIKCENVPNFIRGRDPLAGMSREQMIKVAEEQENVLPEEPIQTIQKSYRRIL